MKIQCQQCASKFQVPAEFYGKRIRCPKCKGAISIPDEAKPPSDTSQPTGSPTDPSGSEPKAAPTAPTVATASSEKIEVSCSSCNATLNAPTTLIGKRIKCPKCKGPISVTDEPKPDVPKPPAKTNQPAVSPVDATTEPTSSAPIVAPDDATKDAPQETPSVATAPGEKIKVSCSNCNATLNAPTTLIGKRIKCPKCKGPISVTDESKPPAETKQTAVSPIAPPTEPTSSAPIVAPTVAPDDTPKDTPKVATAPSEKIKVSCTNCDARLKIPTTLIGKLINCPKCKVPISVTDKPKPPAETNQTAVSPVDAPSDPTSSAPIVAPSTPTATPAAPSGKVKTSCSNCNATLNVPPSLIGRQVPCPKCKQSIQLTNPVDSIPATSPLNTEADPVDPAPIEQPQEESSTATEVERDSSSEDLQPSRRRSSSKSKRGSKRGSKRRSKKRSKKRSKRKRTLGERITQFVSGLVVAVGGLLLLAALYLQFFELPGQTASQDGPGEGSALTGVDGQPAPRRALPIMVTNIKARQALEPSLKMFAGDAKVAATPQANKLVYQVTGKSEFPPGSQPAGLPGAQRFSGKVMVSAQPSTNFKIDNGSQRPAYVPSQTFASGLRLPEGLYLVPLSVIQFADFTTIFDGKQKLEVISTRIVKNGNLTIFRSLKRPDFPRVIASDAGALNADTKGVSLIWVDRNSEIRILENLDATGVDPKSNEITFELPNDSTGGIIVDDAGRVAAMVTSVQDGIGTVRQMSTVLKKSESVTARDVLDFSRLPVSKDKPGKLREAAACLVQFHCKRNPTTTQAVFTSNIEVVRGNDESSKQLFNDQYDVNFSETGQINQFSMIQGNGGRLPGFLGFPGLTSIIELPSNKGKSEWQVKKKLQLGPSGNDRILVPSTGDSNELNQVIQTDDYRILNETPDYLMIERKYAVKSASSDPAPNSQTGDIPSGFPFMVEGKFTYRYDKALKLATSVVFQGVEQKRVSNDLVVPMNLSFEMKSMPEERVSVSEANLSGGQSSQ